MMKYFPLREARMKYFPLKEARMKYYRIHSHPMRSYHVAVGVCVYKSGEGMIVVV